MSYSQSKVPNAPYEIPPPPSYAVWIQEIRYNRDSKQYEAEDVGLFRHMTNLSKAKSYVRSYNRYHWGGCGVNDDEFTRTWTIYRWDFEKREYVVEYEGRRGETIKTNDLFRRPLPRGSSKGPIAPRPGLEDEVEKALASIASISNVRDAMIQAGL